MAGTPLNVTKTKEQLGGIFNKISKAYYVSTPNLTPATIKTFDCELPILPVDSFNTGDADITTVKFADGTICTSMANSGDPDITLQLASFDDTVNDIFLVKKTSSVSATTGGIETGEKGFSGNGYSLEPKTVKGGIFFVSEDRQMAIFMPNVEIYSSIEVSGDTPGYFSAKVTPKPSTVDGAALYILKKLTA